MYHAQDGGAALVAIRGFAPQRKDEHNPVNLRLEVWRIVPADAAFVIVEPCLCVLMRLAYFVSLIFGDIWFA